MRGPGSIEPAEVVDEDEDVEDPAVELKIEKVNFVLCLSSTHTQGGGDQKRFKNCQNSVPSERMRGSTDQNALQVALIAA